jgi:hypothetical protein
VAATRVRRRRTRNRGRHRTDRDRCSGDQDRGERRRADLLAEHGLRGRPQQGAERHRRGKRRDPDGTNAGDVVKACGRDSGHQPRGQLRAFNPKATGATCAKPTTMRAGGTRPVDLKEREMLSENPINRTPEALPDPKQYGDPIVFAVALKAYARRQGITVVAAAALYR